MTPSTPAPARRNEPAAIDWRPTSAQKIGGVVGLAIGAAGASSGVPLPVAVVFPPAYAAACAIIPRLRGIVGHRRTRAFAIHQIAMATIAAGWLVAGEVPSTIVNGAWFASAGGWWLVVRRADRATAQP